MPREPETTTRRIENARRLLEAAGWRVSPPNIGPPDKRDQCEFPDMRGAPGDCCTNLASRNRKTKHGTLWLCGEHFDAPLSQLFDARIVDHAA